MSSFLLTGTAGFIGHTVATMLLDRGDEVVGVDNLNDAYDPRIKQWRLKQIRPRSRFHFVHADVTRRRDLEPVFEAHRYSAVFHLAARAGAPQSVEQPHAFVAANVSGTQHLLDLCTDWQVPKLVLASTSSVYGDGNPMPLSETSLTNRPRSPYAASKVAAEALAHAHHHVHGLDVTVLRYFTVYGPAGRPDMSLFRFIRWIREDVPIILHGDGSQTRDFTYVADIARGTIMAASPAGHQVINLGSSAPVELREALGMIEECLGRRARIRSAPVHCVDVSATWADTRKARRLLGWHPETDLREGIENSVRWYLDNREWARELILP